MAKLYWSEEINGVANSTVMGEGLTSTEAEPKKLLAVIVTVSSKVGNYVEGWLERERKMNVIDYTLPTPDDYHKLVLDVDEDIPVGRTWKAALRCGGTPTNAYVTYIYEIAE